jgi:hypothetical protein
MKVSGFTIARNVIKYDYPIIEAINSILPICDEFIVAVGNSEDDTLNLIKSIKSSKIKIIETTWDDTLRKDGKVLAVETNKAFEAISPHSTWAFYIQADEVLHEKYLPVIHSAMKNYQNNSVIEGLLLNYKHFYGAYNYIADSRKWYRREIRIIRNSKLITSYKDAQGFRKTDGNKLNVALIDAYIYHYGWIKLPEKMMDKVKGISKFWHSDEYIENTFQTPIFDFANIDSLAEFNENHPQVMETRIKNQNWEFKFDIKKKKYSLKTFLLLTIYKWTGWMPFEYKNYKIVK